MGEIKAILVDDEQSARDILENLLTRFCPNIALVDKCDHIEEAVISIKKRKPDLVFLDIEMPNYAGYEIINFFKEINFEIIFITAYDKYAIRAFELAAVDYLLKPIDIDRLRQAVERAKHNIDSKQDNQRLKVLGEALQSNQVKNITVIDKGYQQIVPIDSIVAIEAQESYCKIHTTDYEYMASRNLKHFESIFSEVPFFIRTHKSWIVNQNYIINYSKSELAINLINGLTAKLSKYKKVEFEAVVLG